MEIFCSEKKALSFPAAGEIHIWKIFSFSRKNNSENGLNRDNREVSSVFKNGDLTPSRRIILKIAASYLGVDEQSISLGINDGGKPFIEGEEGLHFNASHCGGDLAVAFGYAPVGFDMERKDRKADFVGVAKRFFSEDEAREISQYGGDLFLRLWTAKEAMLKLTGRGLQGGLANAVVLPEGGGSVCGERVFLKELVWPEHVAHVASRSDVATVREFLFRE